MPYFLKKARGKDKYYVMDNSGRKYSHEPIPLARANKQLKALHIHTGHGRGGALDVNVQKAIELLDRGLHDDVVRMSLQLYMENSTPQQIADVIVQAKEVIANRIEGQGQCCGRTSAAVEPIDLSVIERNIALLSARIYEQQRARQLREQRARQLREQRARQLRERRPVRQEYTPELEGITEVEGFGMHGSGVEHPTLEKEDDVYVIDYKGLILSRFKHKKDAIAELNTYYVDKHKAERKYQLFTQFRFHNEDEEFDGSGICSSRPIMTKNPITTDIYRKHIYRRTGEDEGQSVNPINMHIMTPVDPKLIPAGSFTNIDDEPITHGMKMVDFANPNGSTNYHNKFYMSKKEYDDWVQESNPNRWINPATGIKANRITLYTAIVPEVRGSGKVTNELIADVNKILAHYHSRGVDITDSWNTSEPKPQLTLPLYQRAYNLIEQVQKDIVSKKPNRKFLVKLFEENYKDVMRPLFIEPEPVPVPVLTEPDIHIPATEPELVDPEPIVDPNPTEPAPPLTIAQARHEAYGFGKNHILIGDRVKFAKKYLKGQGIRGTKKNIEHICNIMDVEGIVFE